MPVWRYAWPQLTNKQGTPMEKYFDIRYEFDVPTVHVAIDEHIANGNTGYICVADGMDAQTAP